MSNFCVTYKIDKDNKIVYLSDQWQLFAYKNKASHLTAEAVLNKTLNEFITDRKCQEIYEILINRSRSNQKELDFPFRCDAPDRRRFMSMKIIPFEDGLIEFKSCIVKEEPREPVFLLDIDANRSDEFLLICSWCKKIKVDKKYWIEIEEAIGKMALFGKKLLPELSHGICPICYENVKMDFLERD